MDGRSKSLMGYLVARTSRPEDSRELRLRKATVSLISLLVSAAGVVWGVMYLALGYPLPAAFPFAYSVIVGTAFLLFVRDQHFERFLYLQLTLILLLPVALQWSLGGFSYSGSVIIWSFLAPLGAVLFLGAREAYPWIGALAALALISTFTDVYWASRVAAPPPWIRLLFFAVNGGTVSLIVFATLVYFVQQLKQAHAEAQDKSEELQAALTELSEAQARLIHAEKIASLGELTAGIAHEIKNPLNFVNNFSALNVEIIDEIEAACAANPGLAYSDLKEEFEALRSTARQIAVHGRRADGIVALMMEHARVGSRRQRVAADLNAVVETHVGQACRSLEKRTPAVDIHVERSYDAALPPVTMVPDEIGRVVTNLLNNAFDAVRTRAETSEAPYVPTVTVSTRRPGTEQKPGRERAARPYISIRVHDNGPGVSEAIRDKIFEPFFTTKPAGSGTGLGLSMSYLIVTHGHDGRLRMESEPGAGTAFIVELPC